MTIEVKSLQLRSMKWALGLLRYVWAPFTIAVTGRWAISYLQILTASFIAFAAAQAGRSSGEESVLPQYLSQYFPASPTSIIPAICASLVLVVLTGILEAFLAWTGTWSHVILNRKLTPAALWASLVVNPENREVLDPATAVQRWLLKSQVVEFLHSGVANTLGAIGTIVLAIAATFGISTSAGWVCILCLLLWIIAGAILTWRTLLASRKAAHSHEIVGAIIRSSAALRRDLSRPSLIRFWLARSNPEVDKLGKSIQTQGIWGSLLYGTLDTIANAAPLLALLTVAAIGGIEASIAIYLYVSRLVPALGNLAGLLPVLQDQSISIQRMFDVFARYQTQPTEDIETISAPSLLEVKDISVMLNNGPKILDFPSFNVARSEILCVIGPSGSGKSTLLHTIAGQQPLTKGTLLVDGVSINPSSSQWHESCSLLPQDTELIPGNLEDNLYNFPRWRASELIKAALEVLFRFTSSGKDSQVSIDAQGVSVGQRRVTSLLRNLGSDAPIILLDEPIAGVDQSLVELIRPIVEEISREGRIVILALHEHDYDRLHIHGAKVIYLNHSSGLDSAS